MKKLIYSAAVAAALAASAATAAPLFQINVGAPVNITGTSNDFEALLAGLTPSLTLLTTAGVSLTEAGIVTFEYLGSESGYLNTFTTPGGITKQEMSTGTENLFGTPFLISSEVVGAGALAATFTNNTNATVSTPGTIGFGVFLPTGTAGLYQTDTIYFGYDDQFFAGNDDNHDDMIIRATISAVPEPATWAFMLMGFGAVGYALRRRPAYKMAQAV